MVLKKIWIEIEKKIKKSIKWEFFFSFITFGNSSGRLCIKTDYESKHRNKYATSSNPTHGSTSRPKKPNNCS